MIQTGSYLNVIDNSGAKTVCCIKVTPGYQRRVAGEGDIIIVSVKSLRTKRRVTSKVKRGEIYRALIVRTKKLKKKFLGDKIGFLENSVILLNKQNKVIGTRILGVISRAFRYTKYLKIVFLAAGTTY